MSAGEDNVTGKDKVTSGEGKVLVEDDATSEDAEDVEDVEEFEDDATATDRDEDEDDGVEDEDVEEDDEDVEGAAAVEDTDSLARRIALRAGRIPLGWRIASEVVLVLLVTGSAIASVFLAMRTSGAVTTQRDRAAAVAAAKTEIPQILSYNYKTLKADLARASADTTGQFSGQFGMLASQMIGPNATKEQTVTKARVPVAAVEHSSGNQVTVLVFVDQSTTSKSQPKPVPNAGQIRVTMQKVKGRWLVAQFTAL
ncbi:MAG: hypothetical protein J2P25_14015 [Nocardiopsaceae bacterium]|nr:hypothetical protein [Nocardiopsaceae bacterium]